MREYQFTLKQNQDIQIFVMVDIIDPNTQLFTIMHIKGSDASLDYFKRIFPWNIGSVVFRKEIEKWFTDNSDALFGMYYGDIDGAKDMSGGGGKLNFYLIPPYIIEGIQYPSYMYGENSITILYPMFQYDADDISNLPDIKNMKIGNETYLVEFNETDDPQPGIAYVPDGGSNVIELTPEIIEEYAAIGINFNLDNGHYLFGCAFAYLSDEIHGDLTATFYDSNGNGSSIVVKERVQPVEEPDYLCFTANKAGATLRLVGQYTEGHENDFSLEYSTDGETWQDLNFTASDGVSTSDTLTFENIGDKVYFRGDNPKGTTDINMLLQEDGYSFRFLGGEGTDWRDNEFSLSGDLQTIVDKTGQNKTAGCFIMLFGRSASDEGEYISVTTPPSCSATSLSFYCFYALFASQTTLLAPMDISNIDVDTNNADSFAAMYDRCRFNITSDNGVTLNGFGNIEYPITLNMGDEITINNNFDFAYILLGNFNGFDNAKLTIIAEGSGSIDANAYSNSGGGGGSKNYYYWIPTNGSATAIMTATPEEEYHFVKWQTSNDEGSTWVDIPGATNAEYTTVFTEASTDTHYFKAIFEEVSTKVKLQYGNGNPVSIYDFNYEESYEGESPICYWIPNESEGEMQYWLGGDITCNSNTIVISVPEYNNNGYHLGDITGYSNCNVQGIGDFYDKWLITIYDMDEPAIVQLNYWGV